MSRLTDLIAKAKASDPQLGADLEREVRALLSRLSFGLNFERHRPEAVELPQRPVRRGDKVRVLPPRGSTAKGDQQVWSIKRIVKVGVRWCSMGWQLGQTGRVLTLPQTTVPTRRYGRNGGSH